MSGICGIYSPRRPELADERHLDRMLRAISHRGRKARRSFSDPSAGIAIGHVYAGTFTPAIDMEASLWHQDSECVATLVGTIFNRNDFLLANGQNRNPAHSAETAMAYLRSDPAGFPAHLDGNFALGMWDGRNKNLWLVRDVLGAKHLCYYRDPATGTVLFASEIKGILAHPLVRREIDPEGLTAYLTFGYVPAPLSIFKNAAKVFPGEAIRFDATGEMKAGIYNRIPDFDPQPGDFDAYARQCREHVIEAVARHLDGSEAPGVYFSAGLDSTAVLCALKELGIAKIHTFTMGFKVAEDKQQLADDLYFADLTAKRFGVIHHPIVIERGHNLMHVLPKILRQFDEPILTPNAYSKYFLPQAGVKFGVDSFLTGSAAGFSFETFPEKKIKRLQKKAGPGASAEELFLAAKSRFFAPDMHAALLRQPVDDARGRMLNLVRRYTEGIRVPEFVKQVELPMRMQGTEKAFKVQDRTSALFGTEVRHPLYDLQLIRLANKIPASYRISESGEVRKVLLTAAFQDMLPEEIKKRPVSGYPSYYWTGGEIDHLKEILLSPAGLERTGLFRHDVVQQALEQDRLSDKKSAGKQTWGLLMLQAWYELYINENDDFLEKIQ